LAQAALPVMLRKNGGPMRLIALFLCLLGHAAPAETLQHGNVIYDMPPNWDTGRVGDGIQVLIYDPPDDVCEYCYIHIGTGAAKSGSLADFIADRAPLFLDEEDREDAVVIQAPQPFSEDGRTAALMGLKADGDMLVVLGYELKDRFEIMAFKGPASDEEDVAATTMTLQDQVVPMFIGLQFVSEGANSLLPDPVPGRMDGMWWGFYSYSSFGLDMMMKMELDHRRIVFWPDGYFYDGTPPDGIRPIDRDALLAAADGQFGTYRKVGRRLMLTFATGEEERLTLGAENTVEDDNRTLYKVDPLPDGTPLDGGVSSFFYSGFSPGSGIEGGMSGSSSTTFMPDGTYVGESFGGAFGNFVDGGGSTTGGFATSSGDDSQGGRYEVRDGLLIQYPANGDAPTQSMIYDTGDEIMIDDQFLETE
jgi:hypothetical protein